MLPNVPAAQLVSRAHAHLDTALSRVVASDDAIIINHIRVAAELLKPIAIGAAQKAPIPWEIVEQAVRDQVGEWNDTLADACEAAIRAFERGA